MSRLRKRLIVLVSVALLLIAVGFGFFAYQVQQVPEFYEQAIAAPPVVQQQAAEQFEQQAIELQNQIRRDEEWQLDLTAEEINGWLATALPEKFPSALPPEVSEPRVALEKDRLLVAAKYQMSGVDAIISAELSAFLTAEPNVVAIRIHHVSAGNLPLPLGKYLDRITAGAEKEGIYIRWQEIEGDPQAIVTIPTAEPGDERAILIRTLQLLPGKLTVSGTAEEVKQEPATEKKDGKEQELPLRQ